MAKLTDEQKERIKYLYNEQGYKVTLLADMFGVTRDTIYYTIDDNYKEKRKIKIRENEKKRLENPRQLERKREYNRERSKRIYEEKKAKKPEENVANTEVL